MLRQKTFDAKCAEVDGLRGALEDAQRDVATLTNLNTRQAQKITEVQAVLLATHSDREALRERLAERERQLADRDVALRGLAEERKAALDALSRLSDAPLWNPASQKDPLQLARDERDARRALSERLELMQAASERADKHRSGQPWIGEQQRSVTT
jgi:chromosome segregation ATPase